MLAAAETLSASTLIDRLLAMMHGYDRVQPATEDEEEAMIRVAMTSKRGIPRRDLLLPISGHDNRNGNVSRKDECHILLKHVIESFAFLKEHHSRICTPSSNRTRLTPYSLHITPCPEFDRTAASPNPPHVPP